MVGLAWAGVALVSAGMSAWPNHMSADMVVSRSASREGANDRVVSGPVYLYKHKYMHTHHT